jgi:hypothetical protein
MEPRPCVPPTLCPRRGSLCSYGARDTGEKGVDMGSARLRRAIAIAICTTVVFTGAAGAKQGRKFRARVAAGYVSAHQSKDGSFPAFSAVGSTSDAIVSLVAAKSSEESVDRALDYLEDAVGAGEVGTIGLKAKVVLAAAVGGRDPENFGGQNLVADIVSSEQPDGRLGTETTVFDQALALLALEGAGKQFTTQSVVWLADAQCRDGGWQFDEPAGPDDNKHCFNDQLETDNFQSDTNTTSLAVQVLAYIEESPPEPAANPFKFFKNIRDRQFGGWGYSWGVETTDANSTALVLQAFYSEGVPPPTGARHALKRLQYPVCSGKKRAGAFAFTWADDGGGKFTRSGADLGATIGGVLGLLEVPLWSVTPARKSVAVACAKA